MYITIKIPNFVFQIICIFFLFKMSSFQYLLLTLLVYSFSEVQIMSSSELYQQNEETDSDYKPSSQESELDYFSSPDLTKNTKKPMPGKTCKLVILLFVYHNEEMKLKSLLRHFSLFFFNICSSHIY